MKLDCRLCASACSWANLQQIAVLPHGHAHLALGHAVRAAEVDLEGVYARRLAPLYQLLPRRTVILLQNDWKFRALQDTWCPPGLVLVQVKPYRIAPLLCAACSGFCTEVKW
jgi:hypothetical protein